MERREKERKKALKDNYYLTLYVSSLTAKRILDHTLLQPNHVYTKLKAVAIKCVYVDIYK